jgi:3-oxoacyl-ACP reductase-like protein
LDEKVKKELELAKSKDASKPAATAAAPIAAAAPAAAAFIPPELKGIALPPA